MKYKNNSFGSYFFANEYLNEPYNIVIPDVANSIGDLWGARFEKHDYFSYGEIPERKIKQTEIYSRKDTDYINREISKNFDVFNDKLGKELEKQGVKYDDYKCL